MVTDIGPRQATTEAQLSGNSNSNADLLPVPASALIDASIISVPRLHRRLDAYAQAFKLPAEAIADVHRLLASPLGLKVLSTAQLFMSSMYNAY
jgi:hypothetical protein